VQLCRFGRRPPKVGFPFTLIDPQTGCAQSVSSGGEAITRTKEYSSAYYASLSVDNDVYNVIKGEVGQRFVMTGMLVTSSKAIVGDATVHIYEATTMDSDAHETEILNLDMVKSERVYLPINNVATQDGRHINAHADDSVFNITIFGYYVGA